MRCRRPSTLQVLVSWHVSLEMMTLRSSDGIMLGTQEEAERSATSAEAQTGKPGQLNSQPSFDIVAFVGPAAAASLAAAPEQPAQPGHAGRAAPGSAPAAAAAAPPPPTDALFAHWQRIVSPVQPSTAHQGVQSHPISFDPECAVVVMSCAALSWSLSHLRS